MAALLTTPSIAAIRPAEARDLPALQSLAERAFAGLDGATWAARFRDPPAGEMQIMVVFDEAGRARAMYPGVPLAFDYAGERALAHSASHVAVDPDDRASLRGGRVLWQLAEAFFDRFGGGAVRMVFGCPEPPLMRLLTQRFRVESMWDVCFLVGDAPDLRCPDSLTVQECDAVPADADGLWEATRAPNATGLVRDRAFLAWRFAAARGIRYRWLVARRGGWLAGLAVLREGGWCADAVSLVEWIVPEQDREVERALLGRVGDIARALGTPKVITWFAPTSRIYHRLQVDHGFFARISPHRVALRSHHASASRGRFYDSWYQTPADLEFL